MRKINKIQLLKEPGYIYDLNFIFCLKFNTQLYIDTLPSDNKKEENTTYFKDILNHAHKLRLAGVEKESALKQTLAYAKQYEK